MSANNDVFYMQKALALASLGVYSTSPNPNVGCVIVRDNKIIGQGYHRKAGEPHAEVNALAMMAKGESIGATVYVTLEPCSHEGRTPACVDALIQAKVARVVIAVDDPNPLVSGKAIKKLKVAGITVTTPIMAQEARTLNAGFFKRMLYNLPYIQLKMAASLDGKTAMASGESQWITSALSRQDVQQFRAKSCAILSTWSTVLSDDPQLTVRWSELPETVRQSYPSNIFRRPVRIILDSQNRLTLNERVFKEQGEIWLVTKKPYKSIQVPDNVSVLIDDSDSTQIDLNRLLKQCAKREINTILVEAGAHLAGALITSQLLDELIVYIAPKLLGSKAMDLCILPHLATLSDSLTFNLMDIKRLDDDVRLILTPKR